MINWLSLAFENTIHNCTFVLQNEVIFCFCFFLEETLAFLQVLLLPVWQGVELHPTHLQKFLDNKLQEECYKLVLDSKVTPPPAAPLP